MSFQNSSKLLRAVSGPCFQVNVAAYSTYSQRTQPCIVFVDKDRKDRRNTLLGPNKKFPFPGNVTCAATSSAVAATSQTTSATPGNNVQTKTSTTVKNPLSFAPERPLYSSIMPRELVRRLFYPIRKSQNYRPIPIEDDVKTSLKVELKIFECPKLLKLDLMNLFVNVDLSDRHLTVLNITQKSGEAERNKSENSLNEELEKIQLASSFVDAAAAICEGLQLFGYWADFIDPRSGRPYNAQLARTSSSILEFDQRYLQLGFAVENYGHCKVVQNVSWSKDAFVGTIFTDAPLGSEILEKINLEIN